MATPYRPITTSAGHFLSMQPAPPLRPDGEKWKSAEVWYRGDEVQDLILHEAAVVAAHQDQLDALARIQVERDELRTAVQVAQARAAQLEENVTALSSRRPPKRAERK